MHSPCSCAETLAVVFARFGSVRLRPLFDGCALYHEGLAFGLWEDGQLYLRADAGSRALFEAEGLGAYSYSGPQCTARPGWYRAPAGVLSDPEQAALWARRAFAAAQRSQPPGQPRAGQRRGRAPAPLPSRPR
ncbi:MAG: TfoX/Sxy family protein [Aquimonas sp.]|nr:TfoX/Sxy family protein [Aquimonas sp.]